MVTIQAHLLQAQEECVSMSKKTRRGGKRPVWMSKELLQNLEWKEVHS